MQRNKIRSLMVAGLLFLSAGARVAPASGQPDSRPNLSDSLDLNACIQIALEHEPTLRSARYQAEAARARAGEALGATLPHIDVSAGYTRSHTTPGTPDTLGVSSSTPSFNSYNSGISVRQRLFDFGATTSTIRAARRSSDASQQTARGSQLDAVLNVSEAYYNLLKTRRLIDVAQKTLEQQQAHYRQANAFFTVGTHPKYDVTKAEADVTTAELEAIKANNNERIAGVDLARTLGMPEATHLAIRDIQDTTTTDMELSAGLREAEANRPDLKAAAFRLAAAEAQTSSAGRARLPSIDGSAGYSWRGSAFPLDRGWSVGLSADLPLFDGFANVRRVDEANANERAAAEDLAALRLEARREVEEALLNVKVARDNLRVTGKLLAEAQENMAVAEGRYRAGAGSIIEVTDAQVLLTSASTQNVQARYGIQIARSVLDRALGRGK